MAFVSKKQLLQWWKHRISMLGVGGRGLCVINFNTILVCDGHEGPVKVSDGARCHSHFIVGPRLQLLIWVWIPCPFSSALFSIMWCPLVIQDEPLKLSHPFLPEEVIQARWVGDPRGSVCTVGPFCSFLYCYFIINPSPKNTHPSKGSQSTDWETFLVSFHRNHFQKQKQKNMTSFCL